LCLSYQKIIQDKLSEQAPEKAKEICGISGNFATGFISLIFQEF